MKFLIIASVAESILNFRYKLIQELKSKGFEVHIAAPAISIDDEVFQKIASLNVVIHKIPLKRTGLNPFHDVICLIKLIFLIRRVSPNYLLSYTIKPIIYGTIAARLMGVDHRISMITGVGLAFTDVSKEKLKKSTRKIIILMYRLAMKLSTKVIFQNSDDRDLFIKLGIISKNHKIAVVSGSGVDLTKFKPVKFKGHQNFLIISRLIASKGIREFVEAARIIKRDYEQVTFTIVGWIDQGEDAISNEELQSWVKEGDITHLGFQADVRDALTNCSVYVLPSYREGTPVSVLEAMATGRPIITTDTAGCRETVIDGENGFLVEVGNVRSLVEAMNKFILDPSLIISMGERSLELARMKYDVDLVNCEMMDAMDISDVNRHIKQDCYLN
tara:strand:- start:11337 stop:12500 length:1164 start_codon:yes stop_codon:yes gene_type:complete